MVTRALLRSLPRCGTRTVINLFFPSFHFLTLKIRLIIVLPSKYLPLSWEFKELIYAKCSERQFLSPCTQQGLSVYNYHEYFRRPSYFKEGKDCLHLGGGLHHPLVEKCLQTQTAVPCPVPAERKLPTLPISRAHQEDSTWIVRCELIILVLQVKVLLTETKGEPREKAYSRQIMAP